jgi:exopolysaccharide production protein ExoY
LSSFPISRLTVAKQDFSGQCLESFERLVSGMLIVALSPILFAVAAVTYRLSGRSPLIAHRRVGQHGSELWVLKFRTMWEVRARSGATGSFCSIEYIDDQCGPDLKGPRDPRVASRFARFCRRHSLDELPQLLLVLLGRMSLVGPRPVTAGELERIYGADADEVVQVKPGVAGLWQVSGRNRLTLEERRQLDLKCVRERSLKLYFWIVLRTIPEIFSGANTW